LVKYTDFLISFFFDGRNQTPLMQMFGCYSWLMVNRYCSTHTEYGVTIGFDYRVVGNASKPFMPECLSVKVSWIVMVATDEKKPVVGFIYSLGIALVQIFLFLW